LGKEPFQAGLAYVSAPEYLKTFRGRHLYIYQGNGQLRLDAHSLSFISGWQRVTIPLASIRALTLGEFSLSAKPMRLYYLEVTFLENGDSRTLLFAPTRSALRPVWETNKGVAEWASAVQEALQVATGRTIALNRTKDERGRSWLEVWKTFARTAMLTSTPFLLIPIFVVHRPPNRWTDYVYGPLVAALTLGSLLLIRWVFEQRALRKGRLSEITTFPMAYDKDAPILFREPAAPEAAAAAPSGLGPSGTSVLPNHKFAAAAKRGGGQLLVAIEAGASGDTSGELQIPDPAAVVPDAFFDRQWATALVDRAVTT